MSNLRTRLLGLAAVATAFSGMSYAQVIAGCAVAAGANPSLRAEGETELLADLVATGCTNTLATGGTLFVTTSAPITSKAVTVGITPEQRSDSSYYPSWRCRRSGGRHTRHCQRKPSVVCDPATALPVTGGGGPTTFTLEVANIRVNASAATTPRHGEIAAHGIGRFHGGLNVCLWRIRSAPNGIEI